MRKSYALNNKLNNKFLLDLTPSKNHEVYMATGINSGQFSDAQKRDLIELAQFFTALAYNPSSDLMDVLKEAYPDPPFYLSKPVSLLQRHFTPAFVEAVALNYKDIGDNTEFEKARWLMVSLFARNYGLGGEVLSGEINKIFNLESLGPDSSHIQTEPGFADDENEFSIPDFVNAIWEREAMSEKTTMLEEFLTSLPFDVWSTTIPEFARQNSRQFIAALAGTSGAAIALVMRYLQEEPEIAEEIGISLSDELFQYPEETVITAQEYIIQEIKQKLDEEGVEIHS